MRTIIKRTPVQLQNKVPIKIVVDNRIDFSKVELSFRYKPLVKEHQIKIKFSNSKGMSAGEPIILPIEGFYTYLIDWSNSTWQTMSPFIDSIELSSESDITFEIWANEIEVIFGN